jgi:outer membrane protein OmpA-like peptidoglycan-associated protein
MRPIMLATFAAACSAHAPARGLELQRVILYQNGIGYFERSGHVEGERLKLRLARGELDDVLKTLIVIDRLGAGIATVELPSATPSERDPTVELGVHMTAGRVHDVHVGYAVPTPTWKAAYRVVLDDKASLLQGWAMIDNASQDDWNGVQLVLATGAPMSLALDLHTPQYVARPDATGRLVTPTATGVVAPEQAGAADRDGDGIPDAIDKCPDDAGADDNDGCPDHDRVVVSSSGLDVLDHIVFTKGSDALDAATAAILDAVAATLRAHDDIARVEVGGFAAGDEDDPWSLSARRAAAVRAALVARGVAAARLVAVPYGATRPLDPKPSPRDRRVEFAITERVQARVQPQPAYDAATARTAVHAAVTPASVAGSVRFVLAEPISIRRGAAAMVSILNAQVSARDSLLFRPDASAPGSDRHPFRAVHLVNDTGSSPDHSRSSRAARSSATACSIDSRSARPRGCRTRSKAARS